jgi:hypothetical protein
VIELLVLKVVNRALSFFYLVPLHSLINSEKLCLVTVFTRSKHVILCSNLKQSMIVGMCVFSLCVVLYVGSGLAMADHSPKESYRLRKKDHETEEETRTQQ